MTERRREQSDFPLVVITLVLVVIGVLMVYNASYPTHGRTYFYRQLVFAVLGVCLMFAMANIRYEKLKSVAGPLLWISMAGLVLVFVPGIGEEINGARRWIRVGPIQIQPSEFAKLGLMLAMASTLGKKIARGIDLRDARSSLAHVALPVMLVTLLVVKEDMGTAIVIVISAMMLLFLSGVRSSHLIMAGTAFSVLGAAFIAAEPYRWQRIIAFVDPFKYYHGIGYQVCQSLIALGSGGIRGMGIGEGRQKLGFLPAGHTDFIYAVFGQECGWIGTVLLALLFLFFGLRAMNIALRTKDPFGRLLAASLGIMISGQALLNMLVVTATAPATGVPLPFISYGGSSLALNLLSVGVLLSISRFETAR